MLQKLQETKTKLDKHHKAHRQGRDNSQGCFTIKKRKITSAQDYKPHDYKLIENSDGLKKNLLQLPKQILDKNIDEILKEINPAIGTQGLDTW